jgi:predicted DCC family thiol-disulfide oxidoreductase YuxK
MGGIVFFDGGCALCHRAVGWMIRADQAGAFRYAPLGGETFQRLIGNRANLPDSLILLEDSGALFVRSEAVLRVFETVGGWWRTLARALRPVPRALRDALYRAVARTRLRLFGPAHEACPPVPAGVRERILR